MSAPQMERREQERSKLDFVKDWFYSAIRTVMQHASSFYAAFGIFMVCGLAIAIALTWGFSELAEVVQAGTTQTFDIAVLTWMGAHRVAWIQASLLELTALGTGLVVLAIVAVSALFLWLTEHRYSAALLLIATAGGFLLNQVLKGFFDRPRPHVFPWVTQAYQTSFPSGHAMNSAIVYSVVAYLAARLQKHRWTRALTLLVAAAMIALICISRLYLGVHWPSDVVGGVTIGLAWAAFCVASLEAVRVFAERFKPRELKHERDLRPQERAAKGFES